MQQFKSWVYLNQDTVDSPEECLRVVLANRQILDPKQYFQPRLPMEWSVLELGVEEAALQKAATRIERAITDQENVVIFGDYDADGVCATAILWEAIKDRGLVARPFIPHRMRHGYGLSITALEEIFAASKPDLVITVDNGIVAHPALKWLAKQGVDVIVTDHHQPDGKQLEAYSVVHSLSVCGAAVSWIVSRQISPKTASAQLDLLGLATLADQMPLTGANRSFVMYGIDALQNSKRRGITALQRHADADQKITSQSIQFGLIPRINAMGRLEDGMDSLRLLCVKDKTRADQLASLLSQTNSDRQQLTTRLLELALEQAKSQSDQNILVVSDGSFHEGVIGLLAGKLLETTSKPVVALHLGETTAKASVRSVPGVNIIEFLRSLPIPYLELGGHALAAGFLIANKDIPLATQILQTTARSTISQDMLTPKLLLEARLGLEIIDESLINQLERCQPFGQANPHPIFGIEQLTLTEVTCLGSERQHLKIKLADAAGRQLSALFWRHSQLAPSLKVGQMVRVAGKLEINHWHQRKNLQMVLSDIQW